MFQRPAQSPLAPDPVPPICRAEYGDAGIEQIHPVEEPLPPSTRAVHLPTLLRMCMDDRVFAMKMLDEFEKSARLAQLQVQCAVAGRDVAQLRYLAHRLKGSAAYLGSQRLRETAAALEAAKDGTDWNHVEALCRRMGNELQACIDCLPAVRREE